VETGGIEPLGGVTVCAGSVLAGALPQALGDGLGDGLGAGLAQAKPGVGVAVRLGVAVSLDATGDPPGAVRNPPGRRPSPIATIRTAAMAAAKAGRVRAAKTGRLGRVSSASPIRASNPCGARLGSIDLYMA